MDLIRLAMIGFLALEGANVIALYFFPDSRLANSVGVFNAWEKSKHDPEIHAFVKYLVNWVAGTKLIFILLLVVLLLTADQPTLRYASLAMAVAISSFFWRLFPLVRHMDRQGQITPPKYSLVLGGMILAFILIFLAAFALTPAA
ncbi:MAG: hypothetical protein Kow0077_28710 [Anaerolineae bacterium]